MIWVAQIVLAAVPEPKPHGHIWQICNWQMFKCQVHANFFCKTTQGKSDISPSLPCWSQKDFQKSSLADVRAQWAFFVPSLAPFGVPVKFSAPAAVQASCQIWFNPCAESEQVQEWSNCFVAIFASFSPWASWLRCAASFHLPLVCSAQDQTSCLPSRMWTGCFILVIWLMTDSLFEAVLSFLRGKFSLLWNLFSLQSLGFGTPTPSDLALSPGLEAVITGRQLWLWPWDHLSTFLLTQSRCTGKHRPPPLETQ